MTKEFELSTRFCLFNKVCVLSSSEKFILFGMKDIFDLELKSRLEKAARNYFRKVDSKCANGDEGKIDFKSVSEEEIKKFAALRYGKSGEKTEKSEISVSEKVRESETAILLDSVLQAAIENSATDVHIEEKRIRFRILGNLSEYCALSDGRCLELVRRIKAISKLDILETRKGQDGQFTFTTRDFEKSERKVFVRVSSVPSVSGSEASMESVVLRLLDPSRLPLSLPMLGFSAEMLCDIEKLSDMESGLILICGATGSGKSTTAASVLTLISGKKRGKKIITIEDPPEYVLEGMTQIRVDSKNGMDFSDALRFVFRQDPDVIFVGEIRDEITAKSCMRAALTGHLVIATMHTSGFDATLLRLYELGIPERDVSASLLGIIFQKLKSVNGKVTLSAKIKLEEKNE